MARKPKKSREQVAAEIAQRTAKREAYNALPECTREQQDAYFEKAENMLESTHWYNDCKGVARCAIADYLAFQDGYKLIRLGPYL